jgi:hypothetical protein
VAYIRYNKFCIINGVRKMEMAREIEKAREMEIGWEM